MPVTVKLSKNFYDRFGDELVDELVEWFNLVDATYKSDLRAMNDANFAKFDAKLEQRLAESGAQIRAEMNAGFAKVDARVSSLEVTMTKAIADTRADMIKWSFVFWAGSVAANFLLARALLDR